MTTLTKIDPKSLADGLKDGRFHLIDIREADEHARERIAGSTSLPLSQVEQAGLRLSADQTAVFHCKSGMRTEANCAILAARVEGEALILAGGIDGWKQAGLPVVADTKAPLPMNRQVQISAGLLVLIGVLLGSFVHPAGYILSGFVGAGLVFAGASGWCGMANVLALMPWNQTARA